MAGLPLADGEITMLAVGVAVEVAVLDGTELEETSECEFAVKAYSTAASLEGATWTMVVDEVVTIARMDGLADRLYVRFDAMPASELVVFSGWTRVPFFR